MTPAVFESVVLINKLGTRYQDFRATKVFVQDFKNYLSDSQKISDYFSSFSIQSSQFKK